MRFPNTDDAGHHHSEFQEWQLFRTASSKVIWLRFQRVLPVQGDWEDECKLTLGLGWTSLCIVARLIAEVSLTRRVAWLKRSPTPHPEMREEVDRARPVPALGDAQRAVGLDHRRLLPRVAAEDCHTEAGRSLDQREERLNEVRTTAFR